MLILMKYFIFFIQTHFFTNLTCEVTLKRHRNFPNTFKNYNQHKFLGDRIFLFKLSFGIVGYFEIITK